MYTSWNLVRDDDSLDGGSAAVLYTDNVHEALAVSCRILPFVQSQCDVMAALFFSGG